ncbi:AP2/ERF family transcription factor [Caldifermentibacillus hisashii]|uniref:AP2/ERF family transcription factor n=1 Tax=Caldifermentibacillus hisashii TaxID=996558 RepID=UPI0031B66F3F
MGKRIDLTGKQFGDLRVIKLSDKRGQNNTLLWECKCTCENIIYLHGYSLTHGHYKSCGCKHDVKRDTGRDEHIKHDQIDGTRITALKTKTYKNNKSGHKGVTWMESRQKWRAYIGFKGKQKTLGYFETKEEAIEARKKAEEKYFRPILEENNDE